MNQLIYLIGLIVVILAILSFLRLLLKPDLAKAIAE